MTGALKHVLTLTSAVVLVAVAKQANAADTAPAPNILFVFADQWRADALGYAGDPNVKTPNLDRLANQAVKFTHAVSACPVCCPYRATMMTGRRPLSHGVFLNDVQLPGEEVTIAEVFAGRGYRTGYIGKWHLDGPWLLYDNQNDPYQLENLVGKPQHADLQKELHAVLRRKLHESGDRFLPAAAYIEKWGYPVNETGTVPYTP